MGSMGTAIKGGIQRLLADWLGPVATISIAQLFGTSLWFSANSAAGDLMRAWHASAADIGWLTGAVQLGFICGTVAISSTGLADRFRASRIFVCCAIAGAIFNAGFAWFSTGLVSGMLFRFAVGACLAGIYPLGMKLVIGWVPERAGTSLAILVGMLTLGTALPHGLRLLGDSLPWQQVVVTSSVLALVGAGLVFGLGDGPHLKYGAHHSQGNAIVLAFRIREFRAAAFGYFGHMWELYAFWTIVPLYVARTRLADQLPLGGVSGLSFLIIGIGTLGCLVGGAVSRRIGSAPVAATALLLSGFCSVLFALGWRHLPPIALFILLLAWGATVIADSPQFSALSARACPPGLIGGALAIQNAIGFTLTIVSIAIVTAAFKRIGASSAWILLPGPILGLIGFAAQSRKSGGPIR